MQRLEVSGAVRPIYGSLGVKRLNTTLAQGGREEATSGQEVEWAHESVWTEWRKQTDSPAITNVANIPTELPS